MQRRGLVPEGSMPQAFCENEAWFQNGSTDITTTLSTPKLTYKKQKRKAKRPAIKAQDLLASPSIESFITLIAHLVSLRLACFPLEGYRMVVNSSA